MSSDAPPPPPPQALPAPARGKQTARKSTGGRFARLFLATMAARATAPNPPSPASFSDPENEDENAGEQPMA